MKTFINKRYGAKVEYEPGFSLNLPAYSRGEIPFDLTISLLITKDEKLVEKVNLFIDVTEELLPEIKAHLKAVIGNKADPHYDILRNYLDYHLDEDIYSDGDRISMFGFLPEKPDDYAAMLDALQIECLSSDEDGFYKKQVFIADVGFDPDELFSIFFDEEKNILHIKIKS